MTEIVPFEVWHVEQYEPPDFVIDGSIRKEAMVDIAAMSEFAWTLLMDGVPQASGGVIKLWGAVGSAWLVRDRDVAMRTMVHVRRAAKEMLDTCMANGYDRVQTNILSECDYLHRWITSLGFVPEGVMRKYDSLGRDHHLYARLSQ